MRKKIILLLSLFSLLFTKADASHLMGGEITWDCLGGGQYVFNMKLYRDCNGATVPSSVALAVSNCPALTSITLNLISQTDISPTCNAAGPAISCADAMAAPGWPSSTSPIAGAVQESTYQSVPITISGVPPAAGWVFAYVGCCRNASVTNLVTPSSYGYTLRAIMHSFSGQNASPCFDSSPKFLESPSSVICLGTPFTYNHNAYDPEHDSLNYSFAEPLDDYNTGTSTFTPSNPAPIPFAGGYSANSPLPGTAQNPSNVPATINSRTGEISFTSLSQGNFVTVVKVEAWKCGQLVAEIYREMQIVLLPCASNTVPTVTYTTYNDTVTAGQLVNFTLNAHDGDFLADGVTHQTLTVTATGNEFGAGYTNAASGCTTPPCATLSSPSPVSGQNDVSTTFNWQTSCNHLLSGSNCNPNSNTYTFVFKAKDDFCPAPAERISTVSITVRAAPLVPSPQPRCVSVLPSGDVTLTWTPSTDTSGIFNAYLVYTSNSVGGPYTLLDSIFTIGQSTYTHAGANANVVPVFYYIETRSACPGLQMAPAADTVRTMLLNVTNPGNGTAVLTWPPIASPLISTSTGIYNVYEEYPAGVWTLTGTKTSVNFIDTIFICNAAINYRVEIADNTGCTSVSSVDGGIFQNTIAPVSPQIDTLSVDDNNHALMNWGQSPSSDLEGYIVFRLTGGTWQPVDTVYGLTNTSYLYPASTAGAGSEQYELTGIDSCGNISPLGTAVKTIYLNATSDICTRSALLSWSAYPLLGTGLAGYRVYMTTTGPAGPYTYVGTAASTVTTYTIPGLTPGIYYYFKVQAFDASGTESVSSNRYKFYSASPIPATFSYLRKASVSDPNKVNLTCHVDVAASTLSYKIMRSNDNITYTHIATIPRSATSPITYTDHNVLTDVYSYYYKVINVDSCGYDGLETNIGHTMLLTAIGNSNDNTNTITWNDYETWLGNVTSYNIYRGIDGVMDPTPIANVPFTGSGTNSFTDYISSILEGQGVFNYYVEALEGMGNVYGFSDNCTSNIAEAYQDPIVFIPNAFKPAGVNSVFIPVTTYVGISEYEFDVFNRWGLKEFSTTDINEGWDGTHGGTKAEFGVYVYLVRFKTSKGDYVERKGTVTLIR
ncbi:MAG: hypothetical protein JWP12_3270 [Bacteroidetes bacterium]|nr:hypothetical protein [Bacteroidota bacterium]